MISGPGSAPSPSTSSVCQLVSYFGTAHTVAWLWVKGHEVAHGIAKHQSESDSWTLVATCAGFSRLALSTIALLPAIALGCMLSTVIRRVGIQIWLSQQQEHEADVIGAAIATAAGCSSEDILYAMSCHHFVAHRTAERRLTESGVPAHQQQVLASLRRLMLHASLLRTIDDSWDIYQVAATIAAELSMGSAETRQQARLHLDELLSSLSQSLVHVRDPLEPCFPVTHIGWIKLPASRHVITFRGGCVARPNMTESEAALMLKYGSGGQVLLQAYHASSDWPALKA
ncbi:hypothetical protein ABBQ32_005236 [Trebouxia sp. C0010 RCD-2024]